MRLPAIALAASLALSGCASTDRRLVPVTAVPPAVAKTFQWLASGEAAALSRQAYTSLTIYVAAQRAARAAGRPVDSAVITAGGSLQAPRWADCGSKPPAVILDMDETAILNTGANYDTARRGDPPFDSDRWSVWEEQGAALVDPVPGAVEALAGLRAEGVTPIFISNRQARFAAQAAEALSNAGLGRAVPGETLFLREAGSGSGKDARRAAVAQRFCVLAMVGDQLGDFSDLFNTRDLEPAARRALAELPGPAARWGRGWFPIPNPLYGTGIAGTLEQVYPDHRWRGPAIKESK
jgi:5'-nucleotidase (lipoprotein e(P4) family)